MTATTIKLKPIEVVNNSLRVAWEARPETELYRRNNFVIEFPESVDVSEVPDYLWWTVVLGCLYSHWIFLRPCRVEIEAGLPEEVVEFWRRLVNIQAESLSAYYCGAEVEGGVEIVAEGPPVSLPEPLADSGRCATAFSGGKDSLVQAGLLAEFTEDPVLVTTTSPMPPSSDHTTRRRREVLEEARRRYPGTLVEVHSDFRSCWKNGYSGPMGYPVCINETSDTHLYAGSLMVVGYALGCTHLFLASENEVQENMEIEGAVVHHPHMMYSSTIQRAVEGALEPLGLHYGSLISPLHRCQVQELLCTRYGHLADLQHSCWKAVDGESPCNSCSECLPAAMCRLALGEDPRRMGIDLVKLFRYGGSWRSKYLGRGDSMTPKLVTGIELESQLVRFVQKVSTGEVAKLLFGSGPWAKANISSWAGLIGYARLRRTCGGYAVGAPSGYRPGFFSQVDEFLRDEVESVAREFFKAEPLEEHEKMVARSEACAQHVAEPIRRLLEAKRGAAEGEAIPG